MTTSPTFFRAEVNEAVSYDPHVQEAVSYDPICPLKGALVDLLTGEVVRSNDCGRLYCRVCHRLAVERRARAIKRAEPERFLRYGVYRPVTPEEMREMINRLHRRLRKDGVVFEAAWHVEPNSRSDGAHVHLYQHGSFVLRETLRESACRAGFADVWIESWEDRSVQGYAYGMKLALDDGTRDLLAYWNLGRLGGATRKFWRDGRGGPTLRLREAGRRRSGR